MNKLLKWILAGAGIVVVIFVVASVVLPKAVDPNNYKEEIRAAVREKSGRELTIGGDIQWSVFPWIGFDLNDVELGNRSGFGDRPMLSIGKAGMSVKLMPLFSKKIEIGKLILTDVSVYLSQKADGQNNWEDLGDANADSPAKESQSDAGIDALVVSGIEISNANVTWDDAGQITLLKGFGLTASHIEAGRPFELAGGFSVDVAHSQLAGEVKFGGLVQAGAGRTGLGIEGLHFTFDGTSGSAAERLSLELGVDANVKIDFATDQATLSDLSLRLHDLSITGQLNVTGISNRPEFEGRLKLAEFSPKSLFKSLGAELPPTADENALTSLQADMSIAGSAGHADIRELNIRLDKSTFKGRLKVDHFDHPRLAFEFQVDRLNLDDYVPESGAESAQADLTVDDFRGFTGGGDFNIAELVVAGLTANDVRMTMTSDGQGVRLFPLNAGFYGGRHQGDIKIDASGKRPELIVHQALTKVQADALLKDLTGSSRLQGNADFTLDIRTDLSNSESIRRALSGDLSMHVVDGAVVGIDVAETIRTAKSALGQATGSGVATEHDPKTDFSELSMTGLISQGILTSDDLVMRSPLLRLTGKGTVNLVDETIDYRVKPILVRSLEGQGSQAIDNLSGVPIPVRLTGNLYEPDIAVDIAAAISGSQKAKIVEKTDELTNKLMGKLLGGKSDPDTGGEGDGTEDAEKTEKDESASSLLKGIFGSKKDQEKKEQDDGGATVH